ncbi:MAG: hypothetical protein ACYSWU_08310, partial [Planctomycetota bacterium]
TADAVLTLDTTSQAELGKLSLAGDPWSTLLLSAGPIRAIFEEISGSGVVTWDGAVGDFAVSGTLAPGESLGGIAFGGDLTMQTGSTYEWDLGPAGSDELSVSGELQLDTAGPWTVRLIDAGMPLGDVGPDPLVLMEFGTLFNDSLGLYDIDTSEVGHWEFDVGGPSLSIHPDFPVILLEGLVRIVEPIASQWAGDAAGSYHDPDMWTDGVVPDGADATANFLVMITAPSTVTVESPVTLEAMTFKEDNPDNRYTIAGAGPITLAGASQINVVEGHHTISAPLAFTAVTVDTAADTSLTLAQAGYLDGDVTKTGDGTLVLPAGFSMKGGVQVDQGVVDASSGTFVLQGPDLGVGDGATLQVVGTVNRRVLGVPGDGGLGVVGATLVVADTTDIGVLDADDGYAYQGALEVGPHMLGLKDADEAELYGAHMAGGTISTFNGLRLLPLNPADGLNSRLYGFGTVNGNVVAGIEGVPTAAF